MNAPVLRTLGLAVLMLPVLARAGDEPPVPPLPAPLAREEGGPAMAPSPAPLARTEEGQPAEPAIAPAVPATEKLRWMGDASLHPPPMEVATRLPRQFTLKDALVIALRENLTLATRKTSLVSAEKTRDSAFKDMLPSFSVTTYRADVLFNESLTGARAETYNTTLTASQTLYNGQALFGAWKKDQLAVRQAELDIIRQKQSTIQEVKAAWFSLLEADHRYREAQESLERLRQHERNAQAFYAEGRYWRNEVLQAQVEVARGEQRLVEADNTLKLAKSTLNRLMRRPLDAPLDFQGELAWEKLPWTLEAAFAHARSHRPDLENTRLDQEVGDWSRKVAKADMLPEVTLKGDYSMDGTQGAYQENDTKFTATVTLTWPFWSWGGTRDLVEAQDATNQGYALTYADELDSVMLEVQKAYLKADEAERKVHVLKKALEQSLENFRVNQVRYREQLGTAADVLDAQDLLTQTRNDYISSLAAYLTALATLDLATGLEVFDRFGPQSDQ
ncbi:MAG: TolC family protein [Magnetococcales bacterium]|nr:TolC family protein [Magnetococcales bacterium]